MEDIEDVIASGTPPGLRLPFTTVSMKPRRKPKPRLLQDPLSPSPQIPGTQTIYMRTFGCSHNQSDSEYMAGQLSAFGYALTDNPEEADLWLINTCTVKSPSQSAMGTLILKSKTAKKPLVVAGCVPQGSRDLKELEGISLLGVQQIDRVVEVVEETLKGHEVRLLRRKTLPALDLPKVRKNTYVEILPINVGCLGACTYCKTKHARGHLGSYTVESLVERMRTVISDDVKEIWLSSEDTGAYGRDIGANLPMLLNALVAELPADRSIMLRIGMTNPPFILEHLEEIAKVLRHPCVYAFLHVPVQSGSDVVLDAMNREYTVSDFRTVVDTLSKLVPEMQIATDVICGFPGETDEDFAQTVALIKEYQFPQVHISQFYPRPGTPAARMKKVPTTEVKKRSRELTSAFESFNPYKHMVGQVERIWITEVATDGVHLVGHTKGYVQVLVTAPDSMLGTSTMVKITSIGRWSVFGDVIESPTVVEENSFPASSTIESPASTAFEKFCDCSSESGCYLNMVKTSIENVTDGDNVEENSFPLSSTVEFPSSAAFENFCDGSSESECNLHAQKSSECKVEDNSFEVSSPKESSGTAAFENLCKCSSNPECECYMSLKTRIQNVTSGHKAASANTLVDPSNTKNWLGRTLIASIKPDLLQRRIKGCEGNSDDPLQKSVDRIDTPERRIRADLSMTDGMLIGGVIVSLLTIAVLLTRLFSQMLSS